MTPYHLVLFTISVGIATLMILDRNVAELFLLKLQLAGVRIQTWYLMMKLHPKNPVTNIIMRYKTKQMAKDLLQRIKDEQSQIRD